jgi:hypothetical protein
MLNQKLKKLMKRNAIRLSVAIFAIGISTLASQLAQAQAAFCGNFQSVSSGTGDCGGTSGQTVYYDNGSVFECPASGGGWAAQSASCIGFADPWSNGCPGSGPQDCGGGGYNPQPQPQPYQPYPQPAPAPHGICQGTMGNASGPTKQSVIDQCIATMGVQNAGMCTNPGMNQIVCY